MIVEDDVYGDFQLATWFMAGGLDQVIYAGSFSKTLAPIAGSVAAGAAFTDRLTETKILTGFTTPEVNERLLHRLLAGGYYPKQARPLRTRVTSLRAARRWRCSAARSFRCSDDRGAACSCGSTWVVTPTS